MNIGSIDGKQNTTKSKTHFSKYLKVPDVKSIYINHVDDDEVSNMIRNLNSSKACGPNSIPNRLIRIMSTNLTSPIKIIINLSFSEGCFPQLLKLANVCPIFKKNSKNKCENYRPISLLSNISKLFERSMHTRLYDFLEVSSKFYDLQFGFRKKYSTNHALLSIIEGIRKELDNKTFVCGVFVDLEKAFDTVNHDILLKKLEHYGIRGIANQWFSTYLSLRRQMVTLDGTSSDYLNVSCGVPHGSILGPLLFLNIYK